MPDSAYARTYDQTIDTRLADADYTGAVSQVSAGPNIFTNMAESSSATVYDFCGRPQFTIDVNQALTLTITRSAGEVSVDFNLSTVVDVDYTRCDGAPGHFNGALALNGHLSFDPRSWSCADLKSWCDTGQKSWCGDGKGSYGGPSSGGVSVAGFDVDVISSLTFSDGTSAGAGSLIVTDNKIDFFSGLANAGDGAQGVPAVFAGALALAFLLHGDEPFEGISPMDAILIKAIGAAAGIMVLDPTEHGAEAGTILATLAGLATVLDYTQTAIAVADMTPSALSLAAASDSGVKGDALTNIRQVAIDGTTAKYASVTLYDGDKAVGSGRADGQGNFHITTTSLADGTHSLTAVAKDSAGLTGTSQAFQVTIDTKAATPVLGVVSAQGVSGTAEAGAKVAVYDGQSLLGTATAGADGHWSLAKALNANSIHDISLKATDAAGNSASADGALWGSSGGKLTGGWGDDVLMASPNATLTGGWGRDDFVFAGDWGKATVADFRPGSDDIRIDQAFAHSFAEVKSHAAQVGSDVVITFDAGHVITLKSVMLSSLSAGDFLFG